MKQMHSTYPSILKLCIAAAIAAPFVAVAGIAESAPKVQADNMIDTTDRIIVKYKDGVPAGKGVAKVKALGTDRMAIVARAGQNFGLTMKQLHTTATGANVIKLSRKVPVTEAAALARDLKERDANVEYAEPDRMVTTLLTPNDPRYPEQWHYSEATGGLRANTAWDTSTGAGVTVAVIDTGYRPHADLAGQLLPGYDFIHDPAVSNDGDGRDADASDTGDWTVANQCAPNRAGTRSSWHGTHVAGTIAARTNNSAGVAGVAYNAKVLPVRVLGQCGGYTSDIADAIIWSSGGAVAGVPANANPAKVINMSLGGGGACDITTQTAINGARSRGTVVIVAAGNSNANAGSFFPASCTGVVTVAATNRAGGRAWYSNYGSVVDVAAPGGDTTAVASGGVLSTLNTGTTTPGDDSYAFYQGTSMATPHVAGVAALMLSETPGMTPDQVESKLKATARAFPATCTSCGTGIVDAAAALGSVIVEPPPPTGSNETEPNNTAATANPVSVSGTVMNGDMGSTTDTDIFTVQLPAGKTLTSTLTMGSSSADYDLIVYNSSGYPIATSQNGAGFVDTVSVTNTTTAPSLRYVRVIYYSGGTGTTNGKYTLKMAW